MFQKGQVVASVEKMNALSAQSKLQHALSFVADRGYTEARRHSSRLHFPRGMRRNFACASVGLGLALVTTYGGAQTVPWRAVFSSNSSVAVPGLPNANRNYNDLFLSDAGAGRIGVRLISPSAAVGYWAFDQGTWAQYMALNVTGALGPGRTGAESVDVFLNFDTDQGSAGFDGQRAFVAQAGDPNNTTDATWGVWRWDRHSNVEVARGLTDGILGPGMGANWTWASSHNFDVFPSLAGQVLINADVTSPTAQVNRLLVKSVPGQGNVPCALQSSTDPSLSPNLSAGDYFLGSWNLSSIVVTSGGRAYGSFAVSDYGFTNHFGGIWELCNGAPRPIAALHRTDALGPDIGSATAQFGDIYGPPHPGLDGNVYFWALYQPSSGALSDVGLFWNDGNSNKPLAINDDAGAYGPHWLDAVWRSFDTSSLTSSGQWTAFSATVQTGDGSRPVGLWREQAGGAPELVALLNAAGSYAPEPGRTWEQITATAIFSNGDIILSAETNPNSEKALWLLKNGESPRRILVAGQSVTVPTATGDVTDTVSSYTLNTSGAAEFSGGEDSWFGADGSVLAQVSTTNYGTVYVLAIPSNPVDLIFTNGFED